MTYVVAVSGGVDSIVLLDMMARSEGRPIVVAHFDHGIRDDSHEDAAFVAAVAKAYGLVFETRREELGANAGEALARTRRYLFLREVAKKHNGELVTAHHADDMIETIAINFLRGTGWRGLAVLDSDARRPLMKMRKEDVVAYAQQHNLEWREDSTNQSDRYLRNRVRPAVRSLPADNRKQLQALRDRQVAIKRAIHDEVLALLGEGSGYSRYTLTHIPRQVALECLRVVTRGSLTRPQLTRLLLAVKTMPDGRIYEAGAGVVVRFDTRYFYL